MLLGEVAGLHAVVFGLSGLTIVQDPLGRGSPRHGLVDGVGRSCERWSWALLPGGMHCYSWERQSWTLLGLGLLTMVSDGLGCCCLETCMATLERGGPALLLFFLCKSLVSLSGWGFIYPLRPLPRWVTTSEARRWAEHTRRRTQPYFLQDKNYTVDILYVLIYFKTAYIT